MTALAYTPDKTFKSKGFWYLIRWLSRKASSRLYVMIPPKMLKAASQSGNRLGLRVLGQGALLYVEDDLGVTSGVVDDLINEGIPGREIPKVYKKRVEELQQGLDRRIDEALAWAKENPNGTEDFLQQFLADAE